MFSYFKFICFFSLILLTTCKHEKSGFSDKKISKSEAYKLKRAELSSEVIEGFVNFMPPSYSANNQLNVSYELTIVSNHQLPFLLDAIEVFDTKNDSVPIAIFNKDYLNTNLKKPGNHSMDNPRQFRASELAIAHLSFAIDQLKPHPKQIFHRLNFQLVRGDGSTKDFPMEVALIDFPKTTSISLGVPFKKGFWFYNTSSHTGSRIITEGKSTYAQRFAIDWFFVEEDGGFRKGRPNKNESYATYGIEVFAVADGKVVAHNDGLPENIPESEELAIKLTRETISGNYVSIDIGNSIHAHYAHFIPNSIKVKTGDLVTKGQVIGLLGNSGGSTGPHLHFHLETSSKYPLGGEGVPFHFEEFDIYEHFPEEGWAKWDELLLSEKIGLPKQSISTQINEFPTQNGILKFN